MKPPSLVSLSRAVEVAMSVAFRVQIYFFLICLSALKGQSRYLEVRKCIVILVLNMHPSIHVFIPHTLPFIESIIIDQPQNKACWLGIYLFPSRVHTQAISHISIVLCLLKRVILYLIFNQEIP